MIQIITLIDKLKSFPFGERIIVCSYKSYYKFFENEKDNNVLFNENKKKEYDLVNKEFRETIISSTKYTHEFRDDIGDGIVLLKKR